jgi:hypothetical protein
MANQAQDTRAIGPAGNALLRVNRPLLVVATRVWLTEILISGFNYFILMKLVYEPAWCTSASCG